MVVLEELRGYLPRGWAKVADMLYNPLNNFVCEGGTVIQVKEKFGELRVYMSGPNQPDISEAELLAESTCVICGEPAIGHQYIGWYGPRCKEHFDKI